MCAVLVSRRDAESQRSYLCCICSLCFERYAFAAAVGVNSTLRLMCSYVNLCGLISRKGAKLAKAGWISFTLRLLISFVSFVVNVRCVGFSQRRGGAEILPVLYLCCVF